mmetsp:Transcript_17619/g.40441  ORF Transcript_17619/g.40441 Transcript_17619/m.40441 type:complete len:182 (+) Transcript_17619:72-617(+)
MGMALFRSSPNRHRHSRLSQRIIVLLMVCSWSEILHEAATIGAVEIADACPSFFSIDDTRCRSSLNGSIPSVPPFSTQLNVVEPTASMATAATTAVAVAKLRKKKEYPAFLATKFRNSYRRSGRLYEPETDSLVDVNEGGENSIIGFNHPNQASAKNDESLHRFFSDSLILMYHISRQLLP